MNDTTDSVEQLHARIHSRFAMAERLPGRPALDRLLQQIDFPLQWHEAGDGLPAGYAMPQQASGATRHTSTLRRMRGRAEFLAAAHVLKVRNRAPETPPPAPPPNDAGGFVRRPKSKFFRRRQANDN